MATDYEDFHEYMQQHAATHLDTYVKQLRASKRLPSAREINDPIWGTIVLAPAESQIIDSPLFQRLRETRQLGVAHHVYPSANHSRFEHSLGSLHVVTLLLDALTNRSENQTDAPAPVPKDFVPILRLAALLHDIGHGAMSHVTENALEATDWAENVTLQAADRIDAVDTNSLSEIAAVELIRSPSFYSLLEYLCSVTELRNPQNIVDAVTRAIAGYPLDDRYPFLSDLISGPYDADKLDYISRDSRLCGLPQVLDTHRLIRKLRAVQIDRDQLPEQLGALIQGNHASYVATAVASSGAGTLDELALARALLHDKVYRHHKTRAYEAMIAGLVEILIEIIPEGYLLAWKLTDAEFICLQGAELSKRFKVRATVRTKRLLQLYDWITAAYRTRNDYVAAFAWYTDLAGYGSALMVDQKRAFHLLEIEARDSSRRRGLLGQLVQEFWLAYDMLPEEARPEVPCQRQDLKFLIKIDCVPAGSRLSRRSVLENAYLLDRDGRLLPFPHAVSDSDALGGYYIANRDVSYVYCSRALAPLVSVVTETVFSDLFGVRSTEGMRGKRHVDASHEAASREALRVAGYFAKRPAYLEPRPAFLGTATTRNRLQRIAARWSKYEPPHIIDDSAGESITVQDIEAFIRQFRDPKHGEACLEMLDILIVLGRDDMRRALRPLIQAALSGTAESAVCPLGGPDESGAHVVYSMTDSFVNADGIRIVWPDRIPSGTDHILFLDDFIGSGARLLGCVSGWFELDIEGASTTRAAPLPQVVRDTLLSSPVTFAFAAAHSDGWQTAQARIRAMGIDAAVRVGSQQLPTLDALSLSAPAKASFIDELRRVGRDLMISNGKTETEAAERELGRANWGLLVASSLNTPAQAVTALWANGRVDGVKWQPLLPRRI